MNRYYDPARGRFTTPDPYKAAGGGIADPQSWNRYSYAGGDPINRNDPSGLWWQFVASGNCLVGSGSEGHSRWVSCDAYFNTVGRLKPVVDMRESSGAVPVDFTGDMRNQASDAIYNLSQDCQKALGQHWNLYNGATSLVYKVDSANPYAVRFFDSSLAGISSRPMSNWGFSSDVTTAAYFASNPGTELFVGEYNGKPTNQIIIGANFFAQTSALQNLLLIHDVLHTYTGLDDIQLGKALGLPDSMLGTRDSASEAISTYLQKGCDKSKLQP